MIKIKHKGNFNKTEKFLRGAVTSDYVRILEKYGREGVTALASATPIDSGETANSWDYEIRPFPGGVVICWINTNIIDGVPVAILLQYGHGTRNGGYVYGRDYINTAIRPIFDRISNELWREVTK
jgi:hypothetical protein